jgi:hypothetical protein
MSTIEILLEIESQFIRYIFMGDLGEYEILAWKTGEFIPNP